MTYETLEQQIQRLWASRGIEVIREQYHGNKDGTETWIITGKRKVDAGTVQHRQVASSP
jgi:hypothetical protein